MTTVGGRDDMLQNVNDDETEHDNHLKRVSIRAEIGYWVFQALLVGNVVITSLASSNQFSEDVNQSLDIAAASMGACTVFLGHLNRTNFTKKGVMGAISKTYPVLKQNLSTALDKDSLVEAQIVFDQIENNAEIVNQLAGTKLKLKTQTRDILNRPYNRIM